MGAYQSSDWEKMGQMGLERLFQRGCKRPEGDTKGFEDYKIEVSKQGNNMITSLNEKIFCFLFW